MLQKNKVRAGVKISVNYNEIPSCGLVLLRNIGFWTGCQWSHAKTVTLS